MKKLKVASIVLACLMTMAFISCENTGGSPGAIIARIEIAPWSVQTPPGGGTFDFPFTATVHGSHNPPQTVTWSIDQIGRHSQTTICAAGFLTIAVEERLTELTVRATSTHNTAVSGTARVSIRIHPSLR